jgi:hypothetical protein
MPDALFIRLYSSGNFATVEDRIATHEFTAAICIASAGVFTRIVVFVSMSTCSTRAVVDAVASLRKSLENKFAIKKSHFYVKRDFSEIGCPKLF